MQTTIIRIIFYVLSPLLASLGPMLLGWGVVYDTTANTITIHLETLLTAVVVAMGLSGAVFGKWGIR